MTSGNFASYSIDGITVNREQRQRQDDLDVSDLLPSIRDRGLINPITITREGALVTGERRLIAVKQLGWTHVSVQYVEDLDPINLHLIELEENVKRKNLSWQDECKAVSTYHSLQSQLNSNWDQGKTAEALNITQQLVSHKLSVAKELSTGNTRVTEAPKFSTAINIVTRNNARKRDSAIAAIMDEPDKGEPPIFLGNFLEWAPAYDGAKFNFIHCDFPYGINADDHDQGSADDHGGYADTFETYAALLDALRAAMANVVSESAHLMFWFSMDHYDYTLRVLSDMGWRVNAFPLIWHKSDNTGILPDAKRGPRRIYETAFHGSRGDRFIVEPVSNLYPHPVTKTIHMSEKPTGMLRHFFRMFVDEHSIVLDPTCGSANAIKTALQLGAAAALGIESVEDFYNLAREHFDDDV